MMNVAVEPAATVDVIVVGSADDANKGNDSHKNIGSDMKACLFELLFEARPKGKNELHRRCNVANTNSGIHW
jgi:hypothetical protein